LTPKAVCGGAITLDKAQWKIATDWYKPYQEVKQANPWARPLENGISVLALHGALLLTFAAPESLARCEVFLLRLLHPEVWLGFWTSDVSLG